MCRSLKVTLPDSSFELMMLPFDDPVDLLLTVFEGFPVTAILTACSCPLSISGRNQDTVRLVRDGTMDIRSLPKPSGTSSSVQNTKLVLRSVLVLLMVKQYMEYGINPVILIHTPP